MMKSSTGIVVTLCLLSGLWGFKSPVQAQNRCVPQEFAVDMATPVSSRINWAGDPVEAVLVHGLSLPDTVMLPSGSLIKGKVLAVKASEGDKKKGVIRLTFKVPTSLSGTRTIPAQVATADGWLSQDDENTSVWELDPNRSTRLLNQKLRRRLSNNPGVWASQLGINENIIPQVNTDEFMYWYNRNDVMVGVNDTLLLRLGCP